MPVKILISKDDVTLVSLFLPSGLRDCVISCFRPAFVVNEKRSSFQSQQTEHVKLHRFDIIVPQGKKKVFNNMLNNFCKEKNLTIVEG